MVQEQEGSCHWMSWRIRQTASKENKGMGIALVPLRHLSCDLSCADDILKCEGARWVASATVFEVYLWSTLILRSSRLC